MEVVKMGATGLEPVPPKAQPKSGKSVTETPEIPLAHSLAREAHVCADLSLVIEAWPKLPAAIRTGIVAMIEAASKTTHDVEDRLRMLEAKATFEGTKGNAPNSALK
jgi:hypothetical protein